MTENTLVPLFTDPRCTRRHAIKVFAASAAGVAFAGPIARCLHAALPWGEDAIGPNLADSKNGLVCGDGHTYERQIRHAEPTLCLDPRQDRLWTAWTSYKDNAERILLRAFDCRSESWQAILPVTDGQAAQPELAHLDDRLLITWARFSPSGWSVWTRAFDPQTARLSDPACLAGDTDGTEIHWRPAIVTLGDRALIAWQARKDHTRPFEIHGRFVSPDAQPIGNPFTIAATPNVDCCRPALAAHPGASSIAVAYDQQDAPGTQNVYLALLNPRTGEIDHRTAASAHPATDLAPDLAYDPTGQQVWLAWHSNRNGHASWDIPRWHRLAMLRLSDKTWHQPTPRVLGRDLDRRNTVQGFELVRLAVSPKGAVCVLGRPSHNFCIQVFADSDTAPLYRLPADGWGGRGRLLRSVFDRQGRLWVARRDLSRNVLQRIDGFDAVNGPPAVKPRPEPIQAGTQQASPTLDNRTRRYEWPAPHPRWRSAADDVYENLNLYFGDIHGHSWQSDGMGEPEESFLRARDVFRDDFHALTDHDRFVGQRVMDGQWQGQKHLVEHYNDPDRFVTLFAQEWTTPRVGGRFGFGHFNIYTADPSIPLIDHGRNEYRTLKNLNNLLARYDAIAIPHHIGWTGVPWDDIDPRITPAVEMCSVHGAFEYEGNEPIRHRGGMKGHFVRDGLDRGLRFGFVGGSDQHGLIWHHGICWKRNAYRAGLTGAWAKNLSRNSILDAFRSRRTFATTGVKLNLRFTANDAPMGAEINAEQPPRFAVDVAVPPEEGRLAWLEIIRDGKPIHRYGGEAQQSRYTFTDQNAPTKRTACYYLRVRLADNNMAWSSPVWVTLS